jgi:hypothetical protein
MAVASSEAAKALAHARWGTQRLDKLVDELRERRDELGDSQLSELRALVDEPKGNR